MADKESSQGLTNDAFFRLLPRFVSRWAELITRDIEQDHRKLGQLDPFDAAVLRAYWSRTLSAIVGSLPARPQSPEEELRLFAEEYGVQLGLPSSQLPEDVEERLESTKNRVVQMFEREFRSGLDVYGVTSPIEAIFLMEWLSQRVSEVHGLKLVPQKPLATSRGRFRVDFLVTDEKLPALKLAVELDGHEFHEKTKEQAARDRARERAIVREGVTVLRFTGAEVFKDPKACVLEVVDHATTRRKAD